MHLLFGSIVTNATCRMCWRRKKSSVLRPAGKGTSNDSVLKKTYANAIVFDWNKSGRKNWCARSKNDGKKNSPAKKKQDCWRSRKHFLPTIMRKLYTGRHVDNAGVA